MIIALIAKDLGSLAKDHAFHYILAGFLTVFLIASLFLINSFLSANSHSYSAMASLLFDRVSLLQGALLALLTPWIALRFQDFDRNGESDYPVAGMLATPFQQVLSKLIASALCLFTLVILALPVFCLLRLLGAAGFQQILWMLLETFLFLMLSAVLILHLNLRFQSWLLCWSFSYSIVTALGLLWYKLWTDVGRHTSSILFSSFLLLAVMLLFLHGNRALLYRRS